MKRKHLFLLCLLWVVIPTTMIASRPKPKAGHVLVVGIDGWGSYSLSKASDIPNIRMLMQQGSYTEHTPPTPGDRKAAPRSPSPSGTALQLEGGGLRPRVVGYAA